jgi:hypothetical protein
MTRYGTISANTLAAFGHLRDHGPCRVSAIAELLGCKRGQVTSQLKVHFLAERVARAEPGLIHLTADGLAYLEARANMPARPRTQRVKWCDAPHAGDRADYRGTAMAPDEIAAIHGSRRYTDATEADVRRLMAKTGAMKVHNVDVSKGARRSGVAGFGDSQLARLG